MRDVQFPKKRRVRIAWVVLVLVPLLSLVLAATWFGRQLGSGGVAVAAPPADLQGVESVERGLEWVAEAIKPSVVFVEVEQKVQPEEQGQGQQAPPGWQDFFGPGLPFPFSRPEQMPQTPQRSPSFPVVGQGSGVIIDPNGYIITNDHVVGDAATVTVHLAHGESYAADVVGSDKLTDLAVIKIEPKRALVAAKLGDASEAKVGSFAMAVGYPFGGSGSHGRFDEELRYEPSVTLGVISATNREIENSDIPGRPFRNLLQTDAPINPGNSGGPLVNMHGEVIGINQAIFTSGRSGGNIGVGFAIPIDAQSKEVVARLRGGQPVVRGRIGVEIEAVTEPIKHDYHVTYGVFVNRVEPDSPGAKAGIKADDVITSYMGKKVTSQGEFVNWVMGTKPGTAAEIGLIRNRKPMTVRVTVAELTPESIAKAPAASENRKLGLTVVPLSEEQASKAGVTGGVLVKDVDPVSDGARAGVQPGDIILKVRGEEVNDVESYRRIVDTLKAGEPLTMRVWHKGRIFTAQVDRLSESPGGVSGR
jgi:serine protease Do